MEHLLLSTVASDQKRYEIAVGRNRKRRAQRASNGICNTPYAPASLTD